MPFLSNPSVTSQYRGCPPASHFIDKRVPDLPASKCQWDMHGDNDSSPGPKHNCNASKLETCLKLNSQHSDLCKAANSPIPFLSNNHSSRNKASTT